MFIVGPTATGKSEFAADVAGRLNGEIVNADAFQIYRGFDLLSAKPDPATLHRVPHHLIGTVSPSEQMSAAKYRDLALPVIADIAAGGKLPVIVGGTGLYVKALTHGLHAAPSPDPALRERLSRLETADLCSRLTALDPAAEKTVDMKNRRRLIRAIEIAELSGRRVSAPASSWREATIGLEPAGLTSPGRGDAVQVSAGRLPHQGVFVFRDRDELYQRINERVMIMLRGGAISEVRDAGELSCTAEKMIGVRDIQQHLAGHISLAECRSRIQQATRRYAKRQLTWFRHQTSFESLNLSILDHNEAIEWVVHRAVAGRGGE